MLREWNIKSNCVEIQNNATETFKKLTQAYDDHVLSQALDFRCHRALYGERETAGDESLSSRPVTSRNDKNATKLKIHQII